jgi:2,5-furandicarboxylate decarboxylase 1
MVIAVDDDVDPFDSEDVEWALAVRFRPEIDLIQIPAARGHFMDPTTENGLGTKIGLDATDLLLAASRRARVKVTGVERRRLAIRHERH